MKSTIFLASLLSLMGCASPQTPIYTSHPPSNQINVITINLDPQFDLEARTAIISAIDEWNLALNGEMRLMVVPGVSSWHILQVERYGTPKPPDDVPAWSIMDRMYLVRERFISPTAIHAATLHELGHLLGAQHQPDRLMDAHFSLNKYRCIDQQTIEQVCKFNHINTNNVNYCEPER